MIDTTIERAFDAATAGDVIPGERWVLADAICIRARAVGGPPDGVPFTFDAEGRAVLLPGHQMVDVPGFETSG
jgi:hypothetical protein